MDAAEVGDGGPPKEFCLEEQPYYIQYSVDLTDVRLGRGSNGEVFEAKMPGGVCAVKKMNDALSTQENSWIKFHQEFKLLSSLRHPHIVQFLGVKDGIEGFTVPALVTEKLLTDLHSMLLPSEVKPNIPLDLKFSILHDVAGGLLFLHSQLPPIIHRDLTATNVLLTPAMVAKIADLGMARLIPDEDGRLTEKPGNAYYMPPEADVGYYDESLDVFSFGVLALFTLTQIFPGPLSYKYTEKGKRTEVERRSTFFKQLRNEVKDQGKLVDAVEQCLRDVPGERPKIQEKMLPLLTSAKLEASTEYLEQSKLDLMRTIKEEREAHKMEQETHKREQEQEKEKHAREREQEKEKHKREQEQEKEKHAREREQEKEKHKREQEQEKEKHKREQEQERERHEREQEKMKEEREKEQNKMKGELDGYKAKMVQKYKVIKQKDEELEMREANYRCTIKKMKS
jgi:serine/threonine protein kinase